MATGIAKTRIENGQRVDIAIGQAFNPRPSSINTPIDASTLGSVPPVRIPPITPTTTGTGFTGYLETYLTGQKEQIAQQQKLAETAQAEQIKQGASLRETMSGILGIGADQIKLEKQADIEGKTQKVTDYTNQLEAEQLSLRRQVEKIEKNEEGLFGGAMNQEINRVERESLSKQADLALLQSAANRDLATAQSIIDKKIELKLEPLKQKLEFDKFFYEENKENFTKADERAFALMQASDTKALEFAQSEEKTIHEAFITAAQNGAPESVQQAILASKSSAEALQNAGGYFVDPLDRQLKQAQLQNIYADIAKKNSDGTITVDTEGKVVLDRKEAQKINKEIVGSDAFKAINKGKDALNYLLELEKTLDKYGSTSQVFDPKKNAELKTKYNATTLNLKEFFNLGVLNGPDLTVIQGVVPPPTDTSNFRKVVSLGTYQPGYATQQGINNMKEQINTTLDDRFRTLQGQYGDFSGESVGSIREVQRSYLEQKAMLNPDIARLIQENPSYSMDDIISIISQ